MIKSYIHWPVQHKRTLDASVPEQPTFSSAEGVLLDLVRENQALSKSALVELTQFSRSKITGCVNLLLEKGFLSEDGFGKNTGGRRSVLYTLNGNKGLLFGADIGATSLDLIVTNLKGKPLARHSEPALVRDGPIQILSRVNELFIQMVDQLGMTGQPVLAFGIGLPGPVDFKEGMVVSPPIMPGWDQFPVVPYMREVWPSTQVVVDNDANVMALGEIMQGAARGEKSIIFIKIGSGIGAGIICEGKIYHGVSGCAGDIGHICVDEDGPICPCGNRGCLEVLAGGDAIAELALAAVKEGQSEILQKYFEENQGKLSSRHVGEAAKEGDPVSIRIIRDSGHIIGEVLASLVNFYNPGMIVIGGGVSKFGNVLLSSLRQTILERSLPLATKDLKISFSSILEDAGVIGAANLALDFLISGNVVE